MDHRKKKEDHPKTVPRNPVGSQGPPSTSHASRLPPHDSSRLRINKFFTQFGLCSRREADRAIESGRVTINGRVAKLGDQVALGDAIALDGTVIPWRKEALYIKYHKPIGVTTTSEPDVPGNIIAAIGHTERIFPIGRLDKDSSGLILLTNDGEIVNRILRAEHGHEREYLVQVDRPYDPQFLGRLARGVVVLGSPTRPSRTVRLRPDSFRIILTEGRNRQIRRMCQALGYRVLALHRVRIMHIEIGDLRVGEWKNLSEREMQTLLKALKISADHGAAGPAPSRP